MGRQNLGRALNWALRVAIRCYQLSMSPLLLPSCRYLPSCSDYAAEAIHRHGVLVGLGAFAMARRRKFSLLGDPMPAAAPAAIDRPLLLGALVLKSRDA